MAIAEKTLNEFVEQARKHGETSWTYLTILSLATECRRLQGWVKIDEDEEYSELDRCQAVLNWSSEKAPRFDTSFIESLMKSIETYGKLTEKQREALDKILDRFSVDLGEWA